MLKPLSKEDLAAYYSALGPCEDHGRTASLDPFGYARTSHNGSMVKMHRLAYAEANGLSLGQIKGLVIRHRCDNPRCVNPDHLVAGSFADNTQDMILRGRHVKPKGKPRKLTQEQVEHIRKNPDGLFQRELAHQFGVSPVTIHNVQRMKLYREAGSVGEISR